MSRLLSYGATGYTGRMAAERAKARGLNFEIAGCSQQRIATLAAQLDVPYRVFDTGAAIETFLSVPNCRVKHGPVQLGNQEVRKGPS